MRCLFLMAAVLLAACAARPLTEEDFDEIPLQPVAYVDLDRYMGRWYLIANIPYFAERGNVAVYVDYRRREDGYIEDWYTARDGFDQDWFTRKGLIEIRDPQTNAEGAISFLPSLWQDFAILYLDDAYRYTVIGHPSRNFCWVFAREPQVDDAVYADMLEVLASNHFDVRRVLKIPQQPEQLGALGFQ